MTTNRDSADRGRKHLPQVIIKPNYAPSFGAERFRLAPPGCSRFALMDILADGFAI